jgi:hypothetical protein
VATTGSPPSKKIKLSLFITWRLPQVARQVIKRTDISPLKTPALGIKKSRACNQDFTLYKSTQQINIKSRQQIFELTRGIGKTHKLVNQ